MAKVINNNRIAELWGHDAWTLGPLIFVNDKVKDNEKLLRHEKKHVEQWRRYWYIGFFFLYQYYQIRYGYENNPLEIEAREAEDAAE